MGVSAKSVTEVIQKVSNTVDSVAREHNEGAEVVRGNYGVDNLRLEIDPPLSPRAVDHFNETFKKNSFDGEAYSDGRHIDIGLIRRGR